MALSDEPSFMKDEWGPWEERYVETEDPNTGYVSLQKVLRSTPTGVSYMRRYPSIDTYPGLESWISEGMPEKATETEKKFSQLKAYFIAGK
ncbi:MAG: hypothetical protein SGPRY_002559 [Prymnesium sp.]